MKKALIIVLISTAFYACKDENKELKTAENLYNSAKQYKDLNTTKVALNQMLLIDSTNIEYKDSLARLYMRGGNVEGGLKLAEQVDLAGKADSKLVEMIGIAHQQMGNIEKSEKVFDRLLSETKDYKYLYQKMVIQYEKGNMIEFDSLSNIILTQVETDSVMAKTTIEFPGPVSGVSQQVPLKAATLLVVGKNAYDREQNLKKAVDYYVKSVQAFDQFEMARYFLSEIERMQMSAGRR